MKREDLSYHLKIITKAKRILNNLSKEISLDALKKAMKSNSFSYRDPIYEQEAQGYAYYLHNTMIALVSTIRNSRAEVKKTPISDSKFTTALNKRQFFYRQNLRDILGSKYSRCEISFYTPTRISISLGNVDTKISFTKEMMDLYKKCGYKGQSRYLPTEILEFKTNGYNHYYKCNAIDSYKNELTIIYIQSSVASKEVSLSRKPDTAKRGIRKYVARKVLKSI